MTSILKAALIAAFVSATALATPAIAQIPGISKSVPKPATDTPDQTDAKLQDWLKEARATSARFDDANAEAQLPEGINAAALADRRRDLDQIIRTITRTLSLNASIPEAQRQLADTEAATANWTGFTDKPPYSLLKLDDLLNQRDATKEKNATYQSSVDIFSKSFDAIEDETKSVDALIRETQDAATKPDANDAAKWRLDAARAKSRLLSTRAFFLRSNLDLLTKQAAASSSQLTLLEKQIATVRKNATLSDADLASIHKASDDRRAALRDEVAKTRQRLKDATTAKTRAKTAYDELNETTTGPARELASARLGAAETRVDTLQFISDNLESFESLEGFIPTVYENRRTLITSANPAEKQAALEHLRSMLARLKAWETVSANELAAVNADLAKQDSNTSVIPPDDARLPIMADQRKAIWEKQDFLQRISQNIVAHRKNVNRWIEGYEGKEAKGIASKFTGQLRNLWGVVKGIWYFEVTRSTQTTYVAGVPKTDTKSISLGTIITAVTLFIIAYLFSARISRRLQGAVVGRGHIAEAQANTLRTWLMILVSVGLALTTLRYFEIPLTVFAFFGGALAIGLGFGTQTLIKNFISGIIVLFERKIRVGDVIEIDSNTSGKVVEINTRSSVIRNADGKETLVPNSLFLENRVTNLTLSNRRVRRTVKVGVSYGTSPSQVTTVLKECVERHGLILKEPAPIVTFEDFGDSALIFAIYFWVEFNEKTDASVVSSDVRIMIEKRFEETDISFASAQRDLHLKSDEPLRIQLIKAADPQPEISKKPLP